MRSGFDLLVNVLDLTVDTDIESPPERNRTFLVDYAVGFGDTFLGIAKNGIVETQRLGEIGVLLCRIATGCEVSDLVRTQGLTALTERDAFLRSATGEGFGIPGDHVRLFSLELFAGVGLAVAPHHLELRDVVADADFCGRGSRHCKQRSCE